MTKEDVQAMILDMESIYPHLLAGLEKLRRLVGQWDDLTSEARGRIGLEMEQSMGRAQVEADKLPDFRGRA